MQLKDFNSWTELVDYAALKPKTFCKTSRDSSIGWAGSSFADALNMVRYGWHDAGLTAVNLSSAYFTKLSGMVKHENITYDVTGDCLDVAAYVSGEPEYWQKFEDSFENGPGDVIRIVYNGFFSSGIDGEVIQARGAALVALIQLLEFSGKRTEIVYHVPFTDRMHFRATLKASGDELDVSRLMFAVAHQAMFRRIAFSLYEQHPKEHSSSYGQPYELDKAYQGDIYIPCASYYDEQWTSPDKAQKWILEELAKQGIDIS
jgi:hypothetical protein